MKLWQEIKKKMLSNPKQTVGEDETEITYEDLVIYAESFAERLAPHKGYGILCNHELSTAIALLACFAAEATAIPLSIRYGEKHCRKIIDTIGMPYIISDVNNDLHVVDVDMGKYITPCETPALIMCTSGTSGNPKGVMLSEKNILTNVTDIAEYFDVDSSDITLIARPLYHCAVLTGEFLLSLFKGARILFYSKSFNPFSLIKLIQEKNISVFCGTPTLIASMSTFIKDKNLLPIKKMAISGECLTSYNAEKIKASFPSTQIYSIYGLTEASPRVSYLPPSMFNSYPTSVGIPLKSVEIKIVDENKKELPPGEIGELIVKGDNVMLGYYCDSKLTSKTKKNGWLHTKDLAYISKDGLLYIKGRKDNMIIRSGMNIYPQEIENALLIDKRVDDALVYGIQEKDITKIGLKIKGDFENISEVKELCINLLPQYQIPNIIEIVDEIPKNGSGKKIRK